MVASDRSPEPRPFRFGLHTHTFESADALRARARWAEDAGFSVMTIADHLVPMPAPFATMATIAAATERLRVGTLVLNNDFRHPVIVAREAATIDWMSGGRLELGIGAGHMGFEYDEAGLPFDRGAVRVSRLAESVHVIRRLLAGEEVTFEGEHYTLAGHRSFPDPVQATVPLLVGGNGTKVLTTAAAEADIVGFAGFRHRERGGKVELTHFGPDGLDDRVSVVRDAAGDRFADLELNALVQWADVTDDPEASIKGRFGELVGDGPLDPDLLASPFLLCGTEAEITAVLHERRERFGISYHTIFDGNADALAPIVSKLAGT
ncbi:MAG: TIGR03621 family F420-dependent LLM class oxidoreductase [Actinomycetota bacterium]|nr:TIGR03621 family F420-dependent LLM class oxidoreductase [Actinomycetota bacterium]